MPTGRLIPDPHLVSLLNSIAVAVSGDVAEMTLYTTKKGKLVMYPIAPPQKPPSELQRAQRLRFKRAQRAWRLLDKPTKANWEVMVSRLDLCLTGQNLFISLALVADSAGLATANRKTALNLTAPESIPS